jgi:alkylation response protein AidB-like acyl-CoA dehydrogenase
MRFSAMDDANQDALPSDVEAFCTELRPAEDRCYLERRFNDQVMPLAARYRLLGMPIATEFGGRGADHVSYARALARIGREGNAVRTFFSGHTSIGQVPIALFGNDDQKRRLLPPSTRGELWLAFGLTEPQAGSNPRELETTYRREGDRLVLNGEKYLISNGGKADAVVTFAYPEGRTGRMSAIVVDAHSPGFSSEELKPKVGMPTVNTARIVLSNCAVPATNLLGDEGDGLRIALTTLMSGRLSVAAGCLGVIEDCLLEVIAYAKGRFQHGKEIARHQLVQEHVAAIEMHRASSDALVIRAAEAMDRLEHDPANTGLRAQADLFTAQAKLHAAQAACEAADRAMQVFGGRGYLEQYRVGRHWQDVRVCRIYEGTDEILKLKIAASVLGKEFEAFS